MVVRITKENTLKGPDNTLSFQLILVLLIAERALLMVISNT